MVQLRAGCRRRHARRAALQLRAEGGGNFSLGVLGGFRVGFRASGFLGVLVQERGLRFRAGGSGLLGRVVAQWSCDWFPSRTQNPES